MKVSCSGLVITKQVTASESKVLQARYGKKYAGAPKLKKVSQNRLKDHPWSCRLLYNFSKILKLLLHENNMILRRDFCLFSGTEKLKNNSEFIVYHTIN